MRDARLVERALELRALSEKAEKRLADEAACARGEQIFSRWIGVAHDKAAVERHHRRGEQIQAGERAHLAVEVAQLSAQRFDVFLVDFEAVFVRLQALEHARVVALLARALRFLLGQVLLRLRKKLLLGGELLFQKSEERRVGKECRAWLSWYHYTE